MKDLFEQRVLQSISVWNLIEPNEKVLVGVSGGADSVALLSVLVDNGFRVEVAHCNFCLRGEESLRDERYVRSLCSSLGVKIHVKVFDTSSFADQNRLSFEMAARKLRYTWFEELCDDWRISKIAVAHHSEDNAETLILNLLRGTGLKGLGGIRPRNGRVIRPLLDMKRAEIEHYLDCRGLQYVTDSTNLDPDAALRNKIRLELLPMMHSINPNLIDSLHHTALRLSDAYDIYHVAINDVRDSVLNNNVIDLTTLMDTPAPRSILFELLSEYGFTGAQTDDLFNNLSGESGRIFESEEWRLLHDRSRLVLEKRKNEKENTCTIIPLDGFVRINQDVAFIISRAVCDSQFKIPRDADTACLDLDKVEYPFIVRRVKAGDKFIPLGMDGHKLISDFLTDLKRTVFEKERQLVVCSGNHIAWVVGERISQRFCIDNNTRRVLIIRKVKG